ncbi:endogenous retrovirus group K member 5 Gag polyprotein-like [Patagioenas fasciata]|uniref:endogenous retrovirus group K member 5 Gag polyprotein-like n=1 Tax=Patagioenas fasciata TaxID=372321 RepID=UPI003A9903F6
MGGKLSLEQRQNLDVLQRLLRKQNQDVAVVRLVTLLEWIANHVPDFPTAGTFQLEAWHRVGRELFEQAATGDNAACKHLSTWGKIMTTLKAGQKEVVVQVATNCKPSPPPLPGKEGDPVAISGKSALTANAVVEKGLSDNEAPACKPQRMLLTNDGVWESPKNPLDPGPKDLEREPDLFPLDVTLQPKVHTNLTMWDKCREEALKAGDWKVVAACPMICRELQTPGFQQLPYDVVKDLQTLVKENGVTSSFVINILEALSSSYTLTPHDWRSLLKMILTATQYTLWLSAFRDNCSIEGIDNVYQQRGIDCSHLAGEGAHALPENQVAYPRYIYGVIAKLAMKAVRKLPDVGRDANTSFSKFFQGPREPYAEFLDRLQTALERQIANDEARELLLKQLAFENGNADCRRVLQGIRNKERCTIADMVRACQNIGTIEHFASCLAAALAEQLQVSGTKLRSRCFCCGALCYVKKDCTKYARQTSKAVPPRDCPKCGKGRHWANECRSRVNVKGEPINPSQGNGRWGAGLHAPNNQRNVSQLMAPDLLPSAAGSQGWTWLPASQ